MARNRPEERRGGIEAVNFVYVDESRNLLHLIYVGTLDGREAQRLFDTAKSALAPLRRGFDILADLRDLKEVKGDAVKIIDRLMDLCNEHGVARIVRVVSGETENFGFAIMSCFHYDQHVRFVTCLNLEDAVARLSAGKNSNRTPDTIRKPAKT
jgi:hypothetical protein